VIHAPACGDRKRALILSPGSWIVGGVGGRVRCCRRLMEKSRSRYKTSFLETSIYLTGRGIEGMIHDCEEGEMQLMIFEGQIRSRASPKEIGILSKGEKTSQKRKQKTEASTQQTERRRGRVPSSSSPSKGFFVLQEREWSF
jgi:hypothetical protein